ncbi:type IV pilus biogenesis/stability protein PilW [Aquabacterium sp.]|uniref:type IV pilus biogenesis/stability protein PilW n=1 Tax=Aquabacterium sp. TaxID=1872578 RepID=UPI002CEE131E|nr:type IV pilus biogenesis/stability protein PilW [Aquabacterium sp.]HSW05778.1 type IV pilus biogenesis/stability protein PilW [Aquabacterium sp.]
MTPLRAVRHGGLQALLTLLVMTGLSGCATQGAGQGELRERATDSDQTDADRRARVRLELAGAYFGRGQLDTALDELKLSIAANPNYSAAYNLRGLIYASLGDDALAEDSFRRALQLNNRDADAMHNYGWYLCQRQRYNDANAQFQLALAQPQYRDTQRTLLARGICQARAGQLMEAEGSLMRSYELDPANPGTAINLSDVLLRRGEFTRARFYIGRVNAQQATTNAQSLWLAARIEHKLGNAVGARDLGEQMRSRFPQAPEVQLFDKGRFDE